MLNKYYILIKNHQLKLFFFIKNSYKIGLLNRFIKSICFNLRPGIAAYYITCKIYLRRWFCSNIFRCHRYCKTNDKNIADNVSNTSFQLNDLHCCLLKVKINVQILIKISICVAHVVYKCVEVKKSLLGGPELVLTLPTTSLVYKNIIKKNF